MVKTSVSNVLMYSFRADGIAGSVPKDPVIFCNCFSCADVGAALLLPLEGRVGAAAGAEVVVSLFVFWALLEEASGAALLDDFLAALALAAAEAEGLEEEDAAEGFLEKKENKFF